MSISPHAAVREVQLLELLSQLDAPRLIVGPDNLRADGIQTFLPQPASFFLPNWGNDGVGDGIKAAPCHLPSHLQLTLKGNKGMLLRGLNDVDFVEDLGRIVVKFRIGARVRFSQIEGKKGGVLVVAVVRRKGRDIGGEEDGESQDQDGGWDSWEGGGYQFDKEVLEKAIHILFF